MKPFFTKFPPLNRRLYTFCKRYVDRYNAENNIDQETNGEARLMEIMLPRCKRVFDIGANVGSWTARALQINPALEIHCFEPSHSTFETLLANQFPSNVICNNFGLSSAPAEAQLHIFKDGAGINSLYRRQGLEGIGLQPQAQQESIRLETVDRYIRMHGIEQVDLVKVDVEGHELEVFKGMLGLIKSGQVKMIQFEYGGCNIDARVFLKDYFDFFTPFGYTLYKLYPQAPKKVSRYDQRLENFQYQNWLVAADANLVPS